MIGILDYGIGNPRSILRLCETSGIASSLVRRPSDLRSCTRIVIPGVGHFDSCACALERSGLGIEVIMQSKDHHMPILGVCVGAQLLGVSSEEGERQGLGLLNLTTIRIPDRGLPIPHIGWEFLQIRSESVLDGVFEETPRFYFTHSYSICATAATASVASYSYGVRLDAVVHEKNVIGVQFHPEKSHRFGRKLLEWFDTWNP